MHLHDSIFWKFVYQLMFNIYAIWEILQIWVPSNPRGAERLPPGIVASESDLYTRRLWGLPSEVCQFCMYAYWSTLLILLITCQQLLVHVMWIDGIICGLKCKKKNKIIHGIMLIGGTVFIQAKLEGGCSYQTHVRWIWKEYLNKIYWGSCWSGLIDTYLHASGF